MSMKKDDEKTLSFEEYSKYKETVRTAITESMLEVLGYDTLSPEVRVKAAELILEAYKLFPPEVLPF